MSEVKDIWLWRVWQSAENVDGNEYEKVVKVYDNATEAYDYVSKYGRMTDIGFTIERIDLIPPTQVLGTDHGSWALQEDDDELDWENPPKAPTKEEII